MLPTVLNSIKTKTPQCVTSAEVVWQWWWVSTPAGVPIIPKDLFVCFVCSACPGFPGIQSYGNGIFRNKSPTARSLDSWGMITEWLLMQDDLGKYALSINEPSNHHCFRFFLFEKTRVCFSNMKIVTSAVLPLPLAVANKVLARQYLSINGPLWISTLQWHCGTRNPRYIQSNILQRKPEDSWSYQFGQILGPTWNFCVILTCSHRMHACFIYFQLSFN